MSFSEQSVERLAAALYLLGAAQDPRNVARTIVAAAARAIDCDLALYLCFDQTGGQIVAWPSGVRMPPLTAELIEHHRRGHPLARWFERNRALRACRLADVDGIAQRSYVADEYAHLPLRYPMAIRLASPDRRWHAVVVARGRADFDDGEKRILEMMWPAMVRALRFARRALRFGATGATSFDKPRETRGVVLLDGSLQVELATERARLWLAEYFAPVETPWKITLPSPLRDWIAQRIEAERAGMRVPPIEREPFIQQRGDRYLIIDLIVDDGKGSHLLTMIEEAMVAPATALGAFGLTVREREVLAWVAQGKTNAEVGTILGASARTVQKHLENIFQKLGVESRTAATLRAWQAARFALLDRAHRSTRPSSRSRTRA